MQHEQTKKSLLLVLRRFTSLFLFLSSFSWADYGWIPKYDNLNLRLGLDVLSSEENFSSDADRVDLRYQNELADYKKYQFWVEPEYGFANDWAAALRLNFVSHMVNGVTSGTLASSAGLGDARLSAKWAVKRGAFSITPEAYLRLPFYGDSVSSNDELLRGDAAFASGFNGHFGYRIKKLYFVMSPGFMLPTRGFSTRLLLASAVGYSWKIVYFRLFSDLSLSLGRSAPTATENQNPVVGSGGTYAISSISPDLFAVGIKTGLTFMPKYRIEVAASKSMMGTSAPSFFMFTVNLLASFDYYKAEAKVKVREVPFEKDVQPPEDDEGSKNPTNPPTTPIDGTDD